VQVDGVLPSNDVGEGAAAGLGFRCFGHLSKLVPLLPPLLGFGNVTIFFFVGLVGGEVGVGGGGGGRPHQFLIISGFFFFCGRWQRALPWVVICGGLIDWLEGADVTGWGFTLTLKVSYQILKIGVCLNVR